MRSIVNKLSNFQSFVYASKFNVFCITETWLSDSIYDGEILSYDYTLYRKDRLSRGGGVLVAVNCSIPSSLLPSPPDLEVASVKCGLNTELILCTVYVPPNSSESYLTSLFTYLSDLTCSPNQCLIVGDFNFPDICWSSLTGI